MRGRNYPERMSKMEKTKPASAITAGVIFLLIVSILISVYAGSVMGSSARKEVISATQNVNMSDGIFVNVTLKNNTLYNYSNATNPPVIFNNITKSIDISAFYQYDVSGQGGTMRNIFFSIVVATVLNSGTTPAWSKLISSSTIDSNSTSSGGSSWIPIQISIRSALMYASQVDRELNISFGTPTISFIITMNAYPQGGSVTTLSSYANVTFVPSYVNLHSGMLQNYDYAQNNGNHHSSSSITMGSNKVVAVSGNANPFSWILIASLLIATALAIALAYQFRGYHKKVDPLTRRLKENNDDIVRVTSRPEIRNGDLFVNSIDDIFRLGQISNTPVTVYEAEKEIMLYVKTGEIAYYMIFRNLQS